MPIPKRCAGGLGRAGRRAVTCAAFIALTCAAVPAFAANQTAPARPTAATGDSHLFGEYLAARHAQQRREFRDAAGWFEKALAGDPDSPELISRSFVMEVSVGHFDRALALAPKNLKLDPSDAIAELVLIIDRLKAGDSAAALKQAASLPTEGIHRFVAQ